MNLISHQSGFALLGITALICARGLFFFFNDPEGPNLLIVVVTALFIFLISLFGYTYAAHKNAFQKILSALCIQLLLAATLYFLGVTF